MGRRQLKAHAPTRAEVQSAMSNALPHFRVDRADLRLMAEAVHRLYATRAKQVAAVVICQNCGEAVRAPLTDSAA